MEPHNTIQNYLLAGTFIMVFYMVLLLVKARMYGGLTAQEYHFSIIISRISAVFSVVSIIISIMAVRTYIMEKRIESALATATAADVIADTTNSNDTELP